MYRSPEPILSSAMDLVYGGTDGWPIMVWTAHRAFALLEIVRTVLKALSEKQAAKTGTILYGHS